MKEFSYVLEADFESLACSDFVPEAEQPIGQAVILHGAGESNRHRYEPLAKELSNCGLLVSTFDFSGHGESSGSIAELSLQRRVDQSLAVINNSRRPELPLVLLGFSMSGQTVCDLIEEVSPTTIALCCPAAYANEVRTLPFGNTQFTAILRTPQSWKSSSSFGALAQFEGTVHYLLPEHEEKIPPDVTNALVNAVDDKYRRVVTLKGSDHGVAKWLSQHPELTTDFCQHIVRSLQ